MNEEMSPSETVEEAAGQRPSLGLRGAVVEVARFVRDVATEMVPPEVRSAFRGEEPPQQPIQDTETQDELAKVRAELSLLRGEKPEKSEAPKRQMHRRVKRSRPRMQRPVRPVIRGRRAA